MQGRITIFEFSSAPEEFYLSSNIFVSYSLSEGMSRAVLEALYYGLPCLLARNGCNSEIISMDTGVVGQPNSKDNFPLIYELYRSRKKYFDTIPNLLPPHLRVESVRSNYQDFFTKAE
jgi:glycosyltransferase involved in cell wall biosynthesis